MKYLLLSLLMGVGMAMTAQVDHSDFDALLQKHVSEAGFVNYTALKADKSKLTAYLDRLQAYNPKGRPTKEKLAYYINLYNAATLKLILDHMPLESIMDIGDPWKKRIVRVHDDTWTLDHLENGVIRPRFKDARIHFALVCAAESCPKLLNEAYTAEKLNEQLEKQTRLFINNAERNRISPGSAQLSQLFNWYAEDFNAEDGGLSGFINRYSKTKLSASARISHLEYSWKLNGK